ncbi:transmembrane protein 127-like [Corticium candelabrum]|uniref:transmembrane protein 127-like n=1 Tax=Corticium candelabrum TaxID=121492 RepID=UPI002E25E4FA|nr:transmembrane protein 127-like [Corticium candelabrum]
MDAAQLYMMHTAAVHHPKPARERHVFAAIFSFAHVILLCVALGQDQWSTKAYISDGNYYKIYGLFGNSYEGQQKALDASVLFFLFMSVIVSVVAMVFSLGFPRQRCHCFRVNSVGNIVAVLCCVMACSLWYWFIHNVNTRQTTSQSKSVLPTVTFGYSFYIIVGAGVSSVLATAINLFQSRQLNRRGNRQGTGHYSMLSISADDTESSSPPAYTP